MRDLIIKTIIIFIVAVVESTVGLPILTFALFLVWVQKKLNYFLLWLILVSLFVSILWGIAWWIACLFLFTSGVMYQDFGQAVSNKLLKLIGVVTPMALLMATFLGIDFYWRTVVYGLLSFIVLFIFQKILLVSYENKYL